MEHFDNAASPLRLITTEVTPASELAKTVEALLVVATQPLSPEELAAAAQVEVIQIGEALEVLTDRYSEENSGIVLELVAGGWAFRASAAAAEGGAGRLA
jgi:segregation and condensation protein B